MGAYLSQPKTDKETNSGRSDKFHFGVSCMQGWRMDMEDAHATVLDLEEDSSFFAVFDGHGGKEVAKYAAMHMPRLLRETDAYRAGDFGRALTEAYLAVDTRISRPEEREALRQLKGGSEEGREGAPGAEDDQALPVSALPAHILEALGLKPGDGMAIRIVRGEDGTNELHFGGGGDEEEDEEENEEEEDNNDDEEEDVTDHVIADKPSAAEEAVAASEAKMVKRKREAAAAAGAGASPQSTPVEAPGSPASDGSRSPFDMKAEEEEAAERGNAPPLSSSDSGENEEWIGPSAGCTAVSAFVRGDRLFVANAGDSRCVLSRRGQALALTRDHKPDDPPEYSRILKAGGFVADGRVNGSLNLSRALGDMEYKQSKELGPEEQTVTAVPEIRTLDLKEGDEFLILACDGIWDVLTNQEAVDFVRERLLKGMSPPQVCEEVCDRCLAPDTDNCGKGCDNMSVVVVVLAKYGFPQLIAKGQE